MSYKYYNPNPYKKSTSDCVVRALTKVLDKDWDTVYVELCSVGFDLKEMPSSNNVWRTFLSQKGFQRYFIPCAHPYNYTVKEFCEDNPKGTFLLFVGEHVISAIDGDYFDTEDSGYDVPTSFWKWEGR